MIVPVLPPISELQPHLDKLARLGGAVIVVIKHDPTCTNYATVSHGYFLPGEVESFRKALTKARKKRAACSQAPRGDLATTEQ